MSPYRHVINTEIPLLTFLAQFSISWRPAEIQHEYSFYLDANNKDKQMSIMVVALERWMHKSTNSKEALVYM